MGFKQTRYTHTHVQVPHVSSQLSPLDILRNQKIIRLLVMHIACNTWAKHKLLGWGANAKINSRI